MCGIGGIIDFGRSQDTSSAITSMMNCISHRGPDGAGYFVENNLAMGHRRLSIIDLSDAGHQPMLLNDLVLTYNGEIYNYIELRSELKALGHLFHTSTDAEVLLASYRQWGEDCVSHFNGMWAFAIYDRNRQIVFCSRDRFGKKPFYYLFNQHQLIFCSEIKGILAVTKKAKPNLHTIAQYLVLSELETSEQTFFEGIRKLPASHNATFHLTTHQWVQKEYYQIQYLPQLSHLSQHETINLFQAEFSRAVAWRLRSDVPVATSLSGGLDSSYLAAIAAPLYRQHAGGSLTAITAASVDPAVDESHYASMVAKHCKLHWQVTKPATGRFLEVVEDAVWTQEEPFDSTSVIMQYFVMQTAQEAGFKVMLDGQGADEILMGYYQHMVAYIKRMPWQLKPKAILQVMNRYAVSPLLFTKLFLANSHPSWRFRKQMMKWDGLKPDFTSSFLDDSLVKRMANLVSGPQFDYQKMDLQKASIPKLLRYEDKNSMRFSIETRLPFLDYRLVELALSASDHYKVQDGWSKYILRKAMEPYLPQSITWRKKKFGFIAPDNAWLCDTSFFHKKIASSQILAHMMQKVPLPERDKGMLWRMACLAIWEQVYNVEL